MRARPRTSPKTSATTTSSACIRATATSRRATSRRARPRRVCDEGRGVAPGGRAVYLDFAEACARLGAAALRERYGNVFEMYERHHGRRSAARADADLSRRALHDGRAVGRLRPPDHHPRAVRDRRGQLLRPRRQPARRERADAVPGRRLLHRAAHGGELPRGRAPRRRRPSSAEEVRATVASVQARIDRLLACPRAHSRLRRSIARSAGCCGTAAGCRARPRGCARARARSPRSRQAFEHELCVRARPASSTRSSSAPAASRITSSSRRSCVATRSRATSRAGATSAKSTRRRRRSAARRRPLRARGRVSTRRRAAPERLIEPLVFEALAPSETELSMKLGLRIWRQDGAACAGRFERFAVRGSSREMSLLDALDVLNERLVARRRAAGCVRERLPRGDLRRVRHRDRRAGPRAARAHDDLRAAALGVRRRAPAHAGAVPRRGLPGLARPDRRSQRARPDRAGGRLRLGEGG